MIACCLCVGLWFGQFSLVSVSAETPNLALTGKSAILIDAVSGKILYEKNSHERHYPASTTKILTGLLALESLDLDKKITIDKETPFTEGSRIYLLEGETVTAREVLYGMFLESANDAAVALAKAVSGSTPEFVAVMNKRAKELGMQDTHFVNPSGLHEPEHVSTAYDLALAARAAMQNPKFREYVTTYKYDMAATNKQADRHFYNTNRMLYDDKHKVVVNGVERPCKYEGVTGIKTGYTSSAGGCLVASAKRGKTELIAVTLASTDMGRFADCITLLDYGFSRFRVVSVFDADAVVGQIKVKRGALRQVDVKVTEPICAVVPQEASDDVVRTELELMPKLSAPAESGTLAGTLKVYAGEELCGEYPAVTAETVDKGGPLSFFGVPDSVVHTVRNWFLVLLGIAAALLLLYIFLKRRQLKRKRRQREKEREQREKEQWRQGSATNWPSPAERPHRPGPRPDERFEHPDRFISSFETPRRPKKSKF